MTTSDEVQFGIHAVESVLNNDAKRVKEVCILKGRNDQRIQRLVELAKNQNIKIQFQDKPSFERLLSRTNLTQIKHQGVVAVCQMMESRNEGDLEQILDNLERPALLLILDGVTDPHNLGACLRTADAAGVQAVIAPKDKSATLTSTAIKIACGAADTVPFIQVTNLARTLKYLQQRGIWVIGTAGEATQEIYQANLTGPMALVMGAEGTGMRRLTRETCDDLIKIPMHGSVSSLNVSVATGVCLFEMVRQRRQ